MKNTLKTTKNLFISAVPVTSPDDNTIYFQFFYVTFIMVLLLLNILFQTGVTNAIIQREWGINNFSYYPWWVQTILFMFLFLLLIPAINNSFRLFLLRLTAGANKKAAQKWNKIIWFTGVSLAITFLFYLFRVKYDLLGDMDIRVWESVEGRYVNDEYFVMYLMHYLNIFLHNLIHFTPHETFVFASISSGFFFCFLGLLISDLLFDNLPDCIVFFLFYISIGTLLFFCGYTEIYAIPAVSASAYIYSSLLFLKKKVSIILPFCCMVLAVALHKEQISVLPSFVFLATRKFKLFHRIELKTILILFVISIPLIYILNAFLHLQNLMPLHDIGNYKKNTLFSLPYFWEVFNSQYISSGILIFLLIPIIVKALRGQIQLDDYSKFFLIATLFIYSIIITMNKSRGSGDWDVCSFPSIYLAMFVAYITLTQWRIIYSPRKLFYVLSFALLLNTFNCWAWIGLNSGKKSLDKIEDMLLTDPGWYYQVRLPSEMGLSLLFDKCKAPDKSLIYYKLSYAKYGKVHRAAVTNYACMLMENNDTDVAITVWENAVEYYPYYRLSYDALFGIYDKRYYNDKTYNLAKKFLIMYDRNPDYMLKDTGTYRGKDILSYSLRSMLEYSFKMKDTAVNHDVTRRMRQLHINLSPD